MIDEIIAENNKPKYDFNYLCRALNLLPYHDGAFSPSAIIAMDIDATGAEIELRNGKTIDLTPDQLAELEKTIRLEVERQTEENKARQKEAIRDNFRMQAEAMAELNSGVTPGGIVTGVPTGKRYRQ